MNVGLIVYVHGIQVMCLYGSENESAFEETKSCIKEKTARVTYKSREYL